MSWQSALSRKHHPISAGRLRFGGEGGVALYLEGHVPGVFSRGPVQEGPGQGCDDRAPAQGGSARPEPGPATQSSLLLAWTEASLVPKATLVPSGLSAPGRVMEIQRWARPLPARRGQVQGFEAGRGGGRTREPRVTAARASTSLGAPGMPSCPSEGRLRTPRGTTLHGW